MKRLILDWSCLAVVVLAVGCATSPDKGANVGLPADSLPPVADGAAAPVAGDETAASLVDGFEANQAVTAAVGEVVRVNLTDEYVIVDCERLPSDGEEAKVYRGQWPVGTIRFSGPSHRPFAAADIVSGRPQSGDLIFR